ncbi:MAG: hypothetical protein JOZ69_06835 [Myxococcales bacterium]|nr:hypothetical protein [Myxococcales bacterium]
MTVHREEGAFVVRIALSASFDEDYEGNDDGYAWLEAWREGVRPRVVRAVFEALRAEPRFSAVPASRGKNPEDEVEIDVRFQPRESRGAGEGGPA